MNFEYEVYFRQDCVVPLLFLLFNLVFVVAIVINMIKVIVQFGISTFWDNCPKYIVGLLIGLLLVSYLLVPLVRGGFYLLFEKKQDAVIIEGEVQELFENGSFGAPRYGIEQNKGRGEGIVIDGVKYYVMTYGNIRRGDRVRMRVLPKSKFVLEWTILDCVEKLTPGV